MRERIRWAVAVAVAVLSASVGLMLRTMLVKGTNHPTGVSTGTAILAESTPEGPSAPAGIVDAAPPPPSASAAPDPTLRPATIRQPGASSTAAPRSTSKPPSQKRMNTILGI